MRGGATKRTKKWNQNHDLNRRLEQIKREAELLDEPVNKTQKEDDMMRLHV